MTDADLDFTRTRKPTREQARFVWNSMVHPSTRLVAEALQRRGARISFKTVSRWHNENWVKPARKDTSKAANAQVKRIDKRIIAEINKLPVAEQDALLIGAAVKAPELDAIEKEIAALGKFGMPELKDMQEKERLIFNIVLMRQATRRAAQLALIPKDSAALMIAATESRDSLSTIPSGQPNQLNGHGNGQMLDVTPSRNELEDAIEQFEREQGVAA